MINKVILLGNVGRDPELRYFDKGFSIARFPLATSERGYVANGVQIPEKTEWHTVVARRGLAELAEKYIRKGTQVYVEGKITYRSWNDKQNITHYFTEIQAENIQLLGKRPDKPAGEAAAPETATPAADSAESMKNMPEMPPLPDTDVNDNPF